MKKLNPTYKEYSFADHKEVYLALEQTFLKFGVHYYLIGANARDVQMYKAGVKPNRGTADIDFAVMLPNLTAYDELKNELKLNGFADAYGNVPHRLIYEATNTVVDLLPYGEIAQQNTVNFTDRTTELSVVGMDEVGTITEDFEHPEGFTLPVTPAHGIVILKLISWSEKPERTKDLHDIKALLESAWELYVNEVFVENSPYADLLEIEGFEMHIAAAQIMGRKMQQVLNQNTDLKSLIMTQLKNELETNVGPKTQVLISSTEQNAEEIKRIFNALLMGINDE